MPKMRMTDQQIQDACLRQAIKGAAGYFQLSVSDQVEIAGVTRATWYRRVNSPSTFTVRELRKMIKWYGWNSKIICSFFGVED